MNKKALLKHLPAVHELLQRPRLQRELAKSPRSLVVNAVREVLDVIRKQVVNEGLLPEPETVENRVLDLLREKKRPRLRRVVNATGVVLHTNLGRAVLSRAAIEAVSGVAGGYSNLEYDLENGTRGSRHSHVERLVSEVTGAPGVMVVNNNAAAVLLVLSALARGKEAIVSRGELVEIGGAFRIPEVMIQSGTVLREVGTTNKTYLRDYQAAINEETGLLLKVHTSNYRVEGFTHETSREELVALGKTFYLPVVEDLGSGSLIDLSKLGIAGEPTVQECLRAGVDLVTFSGDKLLGGPQAGFIVGREDLLDQIRKHPLARALRVDKMAIAALEATLRAYLDLDAALVEIPTLKMLAENLEAIKKRAQSLAELLAGGLTGCRVDVVPGKSRPGGGALPTTELDTWLVILEGEFSAEKLSARLRQADPAVLARIQEDRLLLDPRTLLPGDEEALIQAFQQALMR